MRTQARRRKSRQGRRRRACGVCEGIEEKRKSEGAAGGEGRQSGGGRAGRKQAAAAARCCCGGMNSNLSQMRRDKARMTLLDVNKPGVAGYLILSQFRDIDVQDTILDLGSDMLNIRILRQRKHLLELLV